MANTSIQFDVNGVSLELRLPEKTNDTLASAFLVGLPKAGSTLLNRIMRRLCIRAGLSPFSLNNEMRNMGVSANTYPANIAELYDPTGYLYMGFRGLSVYHTLPAFASGHIVYLIRDPRDMVVSAYFSEGFSHRPPGTTVGSGMADEFEARRQEVVQTPIDAYVLNTARAVLRNFELTRTQLATLDHRMWRYEDVIFEKQRWVREMVDYLGLKIRDAVITRVVQNNDVTPTTENKDKHIRRVTPGDHKDKLKPETIEQLDFLFAEVLSAYGYA